MSSERVVYFLTSNRHKFQEARGVLKEYGLRVKMLRRKIEEIQHDKLEKIAVVALSRASVGLKLPAFVEDAGLFVEALGGFPGPYSSYVYRTIGLQGILRLLEGREDRGAEFRSVVAFREPPGIMKAFLGVAKGIISHHAKGDQGFGFDPIFIPDGSEVTFGEMPMEEKSLHSHRGRALRKFARWYTGRAFRNLRRG